MNNEDDAFFWLAYCMEKKESESMQAFLAYDEMIREFPKSPWVDDAIVHQVGLAARFVESGKEEFRPFLHGEIGTLQDDLLLFTIKSKLHTHSGG